ncbi:DUF4743 domain-containing protein [Schlegelella sp. S2-27]|uniref:DUF4743 domain-containing protein n=1 Tax=Caldimonas mangrovi TaxID=2944811 RepID=A0ABT0YVU9_9BURK|nr:NUDIX hydrolase family protein [Caldimonas mangrovi]MCM5682884.1 DUF4743 domain-containing protein [Caldimonas mangrovi]
MPPIEFDCPALRAARDLHSGKRLPFLIAGAHVGSVARDHLGLLAEHATWLQIGPRGVRMLERLRTEPQRSAALAATNSVLRALGLVRGWRDEIYPVLAEPGAVPLALIERAASRFWGTLTFGAHLNGYVCDTLGRPSHLWIARRALSKATDPGRLDNLVGGGVPHGQSPFTTLVRECWEESGIPEALARQAHPMSQVRLHCDIPEGVQQEVIYVYDLELPRDFEPRAMDGEVMEHRLLPIEDVVELLRGPEFTTDAALVTLDFLQRRGLLP